MALQSLVLNEQIMEPGLKAAHSGSQITEGGIVGIVSHL